MFFLHEHPATASYWNLDCINILEAHPYTITRDSCRWGVHVRDAIPEDPNQPYLIKKPTKWMTNCTKCWRISLRYEGNRSHVRLEGGNLTKAESYPTSLVRKILKVIRRIKQISRKTNYPKDHIHMTIPESLRESEHVIQIIYSHNTSSAHDVEPPRECYGRVLS